MGSGWTGTGKRYSVRLLSRKQNKNNSPSSSSSSSSLFCHVSLLSRKRAPRCRAAATTSQEPPIPCLAPDVLLHHVQVAYSNYKWKQIVRRQLVVALVQKFEQDERRTRNSLILDGLKNNKDRAKKLEQWAPSLNRYTRKFYQKVNGALRTGTGLDNNLIKKTINHATNAMNLGLRWSGLLKICDPDVPLYRGSGRIHADLQVGSTFSDKAFFSTTRSLPIAVAFLQSARPSSERYLFKIIKHGNGVDVKRFSALPMEEEVLFRPNTMFRVLSINEGEEVERLRGKITVVVLKEMV